MEKYKTSGENQDHQTQWDMAAGLGAVQSRGFRRTWEGSEAAERRGDLTDNGGQSSFAVLCGMK